MNGRAREGSPPVDAQSPARFSGMRRPEPTVVYRRPSGANYDPVCSFCGRKKSDGNRRVVAGPAGVFICEECIDLCAEILEEERQGG